MRDNNIKEGATPLKEQSKSPLKVYADMRAEKFEEARKGDVAKYVIQHVIKQCQISRLPSDEVEEVCKVINIISSQDKGTRRVTCDGVQYMLSEYEVASQFKSLCQPRGVTFSDNDLCVDLRADTLNKEFGAILAHIDQLAWNNGADVNADDLGMLGQVQLSDIITVPLTPAQFKSYQIKVINAFKSKVDSWISIEELTKPILLSSVKVMQCSDHIAFPNNEWSELPIKISIARDLFEPYEFAFPVNEYLDKFAEKLVENFAQ